MRKIQYIINKSEITAGTRGASLGPEAIFTAARAQQDTFFSEVHYEFIKDQNILLDQPTRFPFAKRIDGLLEIYKELNQKVAQTIKDNAFPFIIASDHGSAGGTICGIKSAYPTSRIGVVWIDAHADIHTPYTTPSGNMHGMPLGSVIGDDNKECQRNTLNEESIAYWEKLKNVGIAGPKFNAEDLVFIAVRDTEPEENAILDRLNIKNFTVKELRELTVNKVIEAIHTKLKDCTHIYISFDVDSMDPELSSYGTGTPVPNGLSPEEAEELLLHFAKWDKTSCIEVVEVNPCLDEKKNKMAEITFDLIKKINSVLTSK